MLKRYVLATLAAATLSVPPALAASTPSVESAADDAVGLASPERLENRFDHALEAHEERVAERRERREARREAREARREAREARREAREARREAAVPDADEVGVPSATLEAIAACESGGDPAAVNPAGYYGKYQFDLGTWQSVGGSGNPASASEGEQDYRAALLYSRAGASPWPVCGA